MAGANRLLVCVGVGLVLAAVAGGFLKWNAGLVATLAFLGVGSVVISVFEPRMEGSVHLSPTSIDLTLVQRSVADAETQLQAGNLRSLDEVV